MADNFESWAREEISDIKVLVQEIKTTVEFNNVPLKGQLKDHDRRIGQLEANQRWLVLAVIGSVITALFNVILK